MSILLQLYNSKIREFAERPLPVPQGEPSAERKLENVFCGDQVTIRASLRDGVYQDLSGSVDGCLLCRAATAWLLENGEGLTPEAATRLQTDLDAFLEGRLAAAEMLWHGLEMFSPLVAYRNRRKCVLLPFKALAQLGCVSMVEQRKPEPQAMKGTSATQ
ncbi:iron-sulfur cluster assembly scaffold protein [Pseudomonas sp. 5Ae-yellow]|uniref:iron-sulfur cluster assembly scaffold protein n=1 Tax=Pseudomonas sp. 5Ae-yellow TaxID=2759848 RepID=UPI0015F509B0|nr:iron-sulfur cluster assembly scaffold protein [Pseudomonas sp. 5Ae-yellow]MBA6420985.1 iron-sulfur cluster assembly scaffold protein [Pseudomonas sp. 5Ae-yellow]